MSEKFTEKKLREAIRNIIKENHHSLSDYDGKWYEDLLGIENLHKYPQDFIDWLNQEDTWAETYVHKYRIKKLINLFDLWVNETY